MKTDSYTNRTQSKEVDKGCNRNLIEKHSSTGKDVR